MVTAWIAQTQAERARAETDLRTIARTTPRRMSQGEVTTLVTALGGITTVHRNADPADKAEVYRRLGIPTELPAGTQTVRAEVDLSAHRGVIVCVRGGT
ncbi:hypothetical protein [Micromonospora sp. BL1]|uniref:hypothetical protein n=1 Tax=Micromonospora sp. BL1 TaxID=2478709 RepID=UPI0011C413D4|nr:hypothetical protein [Micromonospora sp. BL1]